MLYPFKLDLARSRVLQIEMDEAAFRAASFLDERILTPATKGGWAPLQAFLESAELSSPGPPLHFIFHTGHVGSTLLSRLLDETGRVLPLREPLPLRTLAEMQDALHQAPAPGARELHEGLLAALLRQWRRGFATTEAVIVKATSSAARVAPALLDAAPGARAVYLNLRAEPWLATLLAGENSPIDLRGHAPERLRRLAAQRGSPLPVPESPSPGELAALGWLAETTTQQDLLARYPGRVLAVDFEAFLADVPRHLRGILEHFGLPVEPAFLSQVLHNPVLTRYSKAPEHPYDPALRAAVLQDSRQRNREEIQKGLRLLDRLRAAPAP
ncbi:MAG: hypothetical protein AB7P31_00165 [Steroidobacteraceae bacterium]